jgi:CHAD domain-containing protein
MSFRIRRGERIPRAVARMARSELEDAHAALTARSRSLATRVHDVRAAIKKVRALVRLVEPVVGSSAAKAEKRLRSIAHTLAPLRDARVALDTFSDLTHEIGRAHSRDLAKAHRKLARGLHAKSDPLASQRKLREIAADLERARRDVKKWKPDDEGWSAIRAGFTRGYRRARRTMRRACTERTNETFHAWRRAVKVHRYHVHALAALWPKEMDASCSELEELGNLLGREHDLVILEQSLRDERACFADERDCAELLAKLDEERDRIRREADLLGRRLFAERPKSYRERMRRYFEAFEEEPPGMAEQVLAHRSPSIDHG